MQAWFRETSVSWQPSRYDWRVVDLIQVAAMGRGPSKSVRLVSHPLARALRDCGTRHLYADTADMTELRDLLVQSEDGETITFYQEIDGNTTNQPLVNKVLDRFLAGDESERVVAWIQTLQRERPDLPLDEATVVVYTIINGRLGLEVLNQFATERDWRISLELHTALAPDPETSKRIAWYLNRAVPNAFIKVAFTPDYPHAFLIARDLENRGIAVNFTATFSARQVVAAALLANPHRTNIFLGRLNQGLRSELLGEQVLLEAQRQMRRLRETFGVKTLQMGASVRRWQTLVLTAGCDVYTAPYSVLKAFFTQDEVGPEDIRNRLDADYSEQLAIPAEVIEKIGGFEKIERLYRVEPEFIEFLVELRSSPEFETMDGDELFKRFDQAGFGDLFYSPTPSEWKELRKSKLPDLDSPLTRRLPLDTLYSLLAIGDFANFQDQMDEKIRTILKPLFS